VFTTVPPWEVLLEGAGNGYNLLQDVDGRPPGVLPVILSMATTVFAEDVDAGPLGVLPAGPTVATTIVVEDVKGGPPRGWCRLVRQQSSP
jgi:hypothetical protein